MISDADPSGIAEDPADPSNGAAGDPTASALWSTTFIEDATAIRVIGLALAPSAVHEFAIPVEVTGAEHDDLLVNRAHARAGNTALIMRTSSAFTFEPETDGDGGGDPGAGGDGSDGGSGTGGGTASPLTADAGGPRALGATGGTGADGTVTFMALALLVGGALLVFLSRTRRQRR